MLRILADENIPFAAEAFGSLGEVRRVPGDALTNALVRQADVLLVRSVTTVDAALIDGAPLRFVGSATIGTDHVDVAALAAAGIPFHYAPGSNAESVVEYVLAALLLLCVRHGVSLRGRCVGIIGCGNIGARLAARLPALGVRVLANDPPLAEAAARQGAAHAYVDLDRVLAEADVITLHVPLTRSGPHATHHLLNAGVLGRMRREAWLLNTSRGAVVDNTALRDALRRGDVAEAALDVWEAEPAPDPALIERCALATPHIAGYSWDGKVAGTAMLHAALVRELGLASNWQPEAGASLPVRAPAAGAAETEWLHALVGRLYDVAADDARMRPLAALPAPARAAAFRELRRTYPRRRTFARHAVREAEVPAAYREAVSRGLGVTLA